MSESTKCVIGFLVISSEIRDMPINSRRRAAGVRLLIVFAQISEGVRN